MQTTTALPVAVAGTVNLLVLGTYTLTYTAVNDVGVAAVPVTRLVVVQDTLAPVVTLIGAAVVQTPAARSFSDLGATATDLRDGVVRVTSVMDVDVYPRSTPANYSVYYTATDAAGNTAMATRTVTVVDTDPPRITLAFGDETREGSHGVYIANGATANDDLDGDITAAITVCTGACVCVCVCVCVNMQVPKYLQFR